MDHLVSMSNITKRFNSVVALDHINFDLCPGEVHVILGENGAGKSTLMKILSGVYTPDEGEIRFGNNTPLQYLTPVTAVENGVAIIYQELSSILPITIYENIFVGRLLSKKIFGVKLVDHKKMIEESRVLLKRVNLDISPEQTLESLSTSQRQLVEIVKVLSVNSKIIIMDEPTSSLTMEEVRKLFEIIRELRASGIGIIYISHKLNEIKLISDRITVLKDGKYVGTKRVEDVEIDDLIMMMVGRTSNNKYTVAERKRKQNLEKVLQVENVSRLDNKIKNITFDLYKGEILGFAGLIGSGRTELMEALFGSGPLNGDIFIGKNKYIPKDTYKALKNNIALLTEDRRRSGIFQNFEIFKNCSQCWLVKKSRGGGLFGRVHEKIEKKLAEKYCKELNVKCSSMEQNIMDLSGGNQQKVIIAKWLMVDSDIMIFDEPTRGIDVGAKEEIYSIMKNLAENGKSIILVSSDMPELLMISDRIVVFRKGEISTILENDSLSEEIIMKHAAV